MNPSEKQLEIVVIGAGVVGLTTAIKIQECGGFRVTVVAETLPGDPRTIHYTSNWAGARHVSVADAGDKRLRDIDKETFEVMWALSAPGGAAEKCFLRQPQTELFDDSEPRPFLQGLMPGFRYLPTGALPPGKASGASFMTVSIDPPAYLAYLLARFLASGGAVARGRVQHISQVVEGGARVFSHPHPHPRSAAGPDAVVVCAGLGARTLGGVEDRDMYPVRGQTVLLRAPWVRSGISGIGEVTTYIIPRRNGNVIVGGTRTENDWYPSIRPETTLDILQRGLALCPQLAPEHIRNARTPTVEDLLPLVIDEGCGLRPARKGGIRLDVVPFEMPGSDRIVPVVYNYGHGMYGFQTSWGSASVALQLLESAVLDIQSTVTGSGH